MTRIGLAVVLVAAIAAAAVGKTITDGDVTLKHDCGKDRTLTINSDQAAVQLIGTCDRVAANGNHAAIHGNAREITVRGNYNMIAVDAVGTLSIVGDHNRVLWKSGISGAPKITNLGKDNEIIHTK